MNILGRTSLLVRTLAASGLLLLVLLAYPPIAQAATGGFPGTSDPNQQGSVGLEGKISAPPPTEAATITTPNDGQSFDSSPITVAGLCKTDLLVKLFSNNVFVGSVLCEGGSYSLQVGLFSGRNDLVARVYDNLDQAGPDSNVVTVTFVDANFAEFGTSLTLTSNFARRGANPGTELTWPIVLSGGNGPYALSVDWGDNSGTDLQSAEFAGNITLRHTYSQAGVYQVTIKATDENGSTAYLQVIAVANGEVTGAAGGTGENGAAGGTTTKISPEWYLFVLVLPLLLVAFWLGSRNELYVIRKRLDRARGISPQ